MTELRLLTVMAEYYIADNLARHTEGRLLRFGSTYHDVVLQHIELRLWRTYFAVVRANSCNFVHQWRRTSINKESIMSGAVGLRHGSSPRGTVYVSVNMIQDRVNRIHLPSQSEAKEAFEAASIRKLVFTTNDQQLRYPSQAWDFDTRFGTDPV